jgi:hypothetical protein
MKSIKFLMEKNIYLFIIDFFLLIFSFSFSRTATLAQNQQQQQQQQQGTSKRG